MISVISRTYDRRTIRAGVTYSFEGRVRRGLPFSEFQNVGPVFEAKVVASSHDFFLFANVPPGVPNPTKMDKSTSRTTERINNHQFSSVLLAMYNTLWTDFCGSGRSCQQSL